MFCNLLHYNYNSIIIIIIIYYNIYIILNKKYYKKKSITCFRSEFPFNFLCFHAFGICALANFIGINCESCLLCIWFIERYFCDVIYHALSRLP